MQRRQTKGQRQFNREKTVSSANGTETIWIFMCEKMNLGPDFLPLTKIISKGIIDKCKI